MRMLRRVKESEETYLEYEILGNEQIGYHVKISRWEGNRCAEQAISEVLCDEKIFVEAFVETLVKEQIPPILLSDITEDILYANKYCIYSFLKKK